MAQSTMLIVGNSMQPVCAPFIADGVRRLSSEDERQSIFRFGGRRARINPLLALCFAFASATLSSGCAVITVVGATASVAAAVASTAVDVGVGAVKVTGKVIAKGVDLATGSPSTPPQP